MFSVKRNMGKYLVIAKNSLQEYFTYRLNFILWRVRVVISILISFFLWQTIFRDRSQVFGYSQAQMLTYIILLTLMNGVVLSTRVFRVAEEINLGKLSNILIRPVNYFGYTFARDISDKGINIFFSVIEIMLLVLLLHPPLIVQTQIFFLSLFIFFLIMAAILYFEIGMILSCIGFWSRETWGPQFIFFILVAFLAGTYFPLDILPYPVYNLLQLLPFTYLVYFPLKIYLGTISYQYILRGFLILTFWIFTLWRVLNLLWRKGLKLYTSEGQ